MELQLNAARPAGCGAALAPLYWPLCAGWGIAVQAAAALGLLCSVVLMLAVLPLCCRRHQPATLPDALPTSLSALLLFLMATAGIFALPYAFIISLSPQTCPVRVFVFGVAFSLAFGGLLARALALLQLPLARGWREAGLAAVLALVQAVLAAEWLLVVLVQDGRSCHYTPPQFAMLQIYVLLLLAVALVSAIHLLRHTGVSYSYSSSGHAHRRLTLQGVLLLLTLLLSAAIWAVWIAMLTFGNRSAAWDDPLISVALAANGWVLLLGHGFTQVLFMFKHKARPKDPPLDFMGWTSAGMQMEPKTGLENSGYQTADRRGEEDAAPAVVMTEISTEKDYSIPRPTATNTHQPYDDYYCTQRV
ncbi:G-protein coupled receptor family C group 5 member B [Danio rerio]|uniref:G-protein coupled receptor family C group 5 member B n=1 Tax=Danio rerio TaxID=7955 RepID=A0AC58IZY3_DANRE|nr:G-protein coupled receptor family C group 5 member B-like [Danio rerio]|eukprot:XP_021326478.1 G-protein coupled receptor family C group 5 member B-like [Danio rerio]